MFPLQGFTYDNKLQQGTVFFFSQYQSVLQSDCVSVISFPFQQPHVKNYPEVTLLNQTTCCCEKTNFRSSCRMIDGVLRIGMQSDETFPEILLLWWSRLY